MSHIYTSADQLIGRTPPAGADPSGEEIRPEGPYPGEAGVSEPRRVREGPHRPGYDR